jgi:hypothetical protein
LKGKDYVKKQLDITALLRLI